MHPHALWVSESACESITTNQSHKTQLSHTRTYCRNLLCIWDLRWQTYLLCLLSKHNGMSAICKAFRPLYCRKFHSWLHVTCVANLGSIDILFQLRISFFQTRYVAEMFACCTTIDNCLYNIFIYQHVTRRLTCSLFRCMEFHRLVTQLFAYKLVP